MLSWQLLKKVGFYKILILLRLGSVMWYSCMPFNIPEHHFILLHLDPAVWCIYIWSTLVEIVDFDFGCVAPHSCLETISTLSQAGPENDIIFVFLYKWLSLSQTLIIKLPIKVKNNPINVWYWYMFHLTYISTFFISIPLLSCIVSSQNLRVYFLHYYLLV